MPESSLREFPNVPVPGNITAAEYGAELISIPSNPDNPVDGDKFCDSISSYKKINGNTLKPVFQHKIPPVRTAKFRDTLLIRKDEGVVKGMWDAVRDSGWRGLEGYLRHVERSPAVNVLYGCLSALTSISDGAYQLKHEAAILFFPHLKCSPEVTIQQASQVRNWHRAWLKAIAWHPNYGKFALALNDDSVRICQVGQEIIPLLRCSEQKNVSSISWRPFTGMQIAIGVEAGIIIWELENCCTIKPGSCQSKLLHVKNHSPVTCVEYSHSGLYILSSSSFDMSIYIWDANTYDNIPLHRVGGGGVPFVSWSPSDDRVLATSPSSVFRIWEREKHWLPKRWNTPKLPIESACWTPDSTTLLFASGEMIYAVHFVVNPIEKFINENTCVAAPIYDISECVAFCEDDKLQYKVGGRVRKMDIDPSGSRLVVCFDDSELIAVFRVQPRSLYYLAPCGFIRGFPDEYPLTITFQKDFTDGALLTIAWNSGRLQYFPFLFAGVDLQKNYLHQDYYKIPPVLQKTQKSKAKTSLNASELGLGDISMSQLNRNKNKDKDASANEEEEDVIYPKDNNESFRTTSFHDAPKSDDFEFQPKSTRPPRLFSLGSPS